MSLPGNATTRARGLDRVVATSEHVHQSSDLAGAGGIEGRDSSTGSALGAVAGCEIAGVGVVVNSGSRAGTGSDTLRFAVAVVTTGDGCLSNGGSEELFVDGGANNTGCANNGLI